MGGGGIMASPVRIVVTIALATGAWSLTPAWAADPGSGRSPSAFDSLLAAPAMKTDLLERAVLDRNPTLAAAAATAAEAAARADLAGRLMSPTIEGMVAPRALGNEDLPAPGYQIGLSQS